MVTCEIVMDVKASTYLTFIGPVHNADSICQFDLLIDRGSMSLSAAQFN